MNQIADIAWPVVALFASGFAFDAFRQWLKRDATTVKDLKREISELTAEWTHKFEREKEQNERRIGAIERALNAQGQREGRNPLGAHYTTRGGG